MKQAVILAAGEGRRLKPFTVNKSKAMLSIAGKPIIRYVIDALTANGIRDIVIVAGYEKEQIFDYIGDGKQFGAEVTFVIQNKQLGTAHALTQAKKALNNEFLVLSGNRLISAETISRIVQTEAPAILIKKADYPSLYGVVNFKDSKLNGIVEKPVQAASDYISTGIYAIKKSLFKYIEAELTLPNVFNSMIAEGITVKVLETLNTWLDVIYPWDILNLNAVVLRNIQSSQNGIIEAGVQLSGNVSIGKDSIIHSNSYIMGPVTIGNGCQIGPNVCIFPATSIGDNVIISPFTELRNCVIGNDIKIASGAALEDTIIDNGSNAGAHFTVCSEKTEVKVDEVHYEVKTGAMVGSSCQIGNLVTARAGTIIGNNTKINCLKVVSGNIPERSLII